METILIERVNAIKPEVLAALELLLPQLTRAAIPDTQTLQKMLDSSTVLVVARQADQSAPIIGAGTLAVFQTLSGFHAHIEDIIVDEHLRGQGVGQALVLYLLQIAREMGLSGVSLTCNPRRVAANRLYQKMGFKKWETNTYWYDL
jgi:ribosomal protein S18 acetylase RimI-like enzyme